MRYVAVAVAASLITIADHVECSADLFKCVNDQGKVVITNQQCPDRYRVAVEEEETNTTETSSANTVEEETHPISPIPTKADASQSDMEERQLAVERRLEEAELKSKAASQSSAELEKRLKESEKRLQEAERKVQSIKAPSTSVKGSSMKTGTTGSKPEPYFTREDTVTSCTWGGNRMTNHIHYFSDGSRHVVDSRISYKDPRCAKVANDPKNPFRR